MTAAPEASCRRLAGAQGPVNLVEETVAATFEVISNVTFSGGGRFDPEAVHQALDAYIAKTAKLSSAMPFCPSAGARASASAPALSCKRR